MDPYVILGISKNATFKEIRSRYILLVKKYHPDKNEEDTKDKFQKIEMAYYKLIKESKSKPHESKPKPPEPKPQESKPKPPEPPESPEPPPQPKFKKGQGLDSFLNELKQDFYKKTGKKKDKWFDF